MASDRTAETPRKLPSPSSGRFSAIVAACVFVIAFVLTNVPGNPVIGPPEIVTDGKYGPHFECGVESMLHGWPFTHLKHDGWIEATFRGCSAWEIGDNPKFFAGALAANIAVWLISGAIAYWLIRGRVSQHGWRFGLRHLLLAICSLSTIGAYINYRLRVHRAQVQLLRQHNQTTADADWQPFGPLWLRSLTGPRYWNWGDQLVAVYVHHPDEIRDVPGKRSIKVLKLTGCNLADFPDLDEFANLVAVDNCFGYAKNETEMREFLRAIAKCRSIQGLNLYESGVTDGGLAELAPLKNLANLELANNDDISDEGIEYLKSFKSLKRLTLFGTRVTKNGIERLRAALPDCEIEW